MINKQPRTKFCPLCAARIGYLTLMFPNDVYWTQAPVCKKCKRAFFIHYSDPVTKDDILYDEDLEELKWNKRIKDDNIQSS